MTLNVSAAPSSRTTAGGVRAEQHGETVLDVRDLRTYFSTRLGDIKAVDGISYRVVKGETVALVGESGSGKTVSGLSILRLMPSPQARIISGEIMFGGRDLLKLPEREMCRIRGHEIALISQEPMAALNQVLTIRQQITEPLRLHLGLTAAQAAERAIELLDMVGIPSARRRLDEYPYQFSGGMLQRVMIATALSCQPKLLIADEPTTALDVTIQAQVMETLRETTAAFGTSVILITHNLGVVARYADRVNVMYAGRLIESGSAAEIFRRPRHPYTQGLLMSVPRLDQRRGSRLHAISGSPPDLLRLPQGCSFQARCTAVESRCRLEMPPLADMGRGNASACWRAANLVWTGETAGYSAGGPPITLPAPEASEPMVDVRNMRMHFASKRKLFFRTSSASIRAVEDVSFIIRRGETLGLVGESGSGKTTVGRCLLKLCEPTGGDVTFQGFKLRGIAKRQLKVLRQRMQLIFQDPYGSLNARMSIGDMISEPLWIHGLVSGAQESGRRVDALLEMVGLDSSMRSRFPHQLSGGQRQRIGIARALAVEPDLVVADEPVSALDVSVQAQIINLMEDIQDRLGLAYLFISHDLAVVRHISDRLAVMYLGRIMETAESDALYEDPLHPYTKSLLAAVPVADPDLERKRPHVILQGEIPGPMNPPSGCVFHTRCPMAIDECSKAVPPLREVKSGRWAACLRL